MNYANPLRFGVMCKTGGISQFGRACIENITRDGLAQPHLLILDPTVVRPSGMSTKLRKVVRLEGNLSYLHSKLWPSEDIPAYKKQSLDECCPSVARVVCTPELRGKWSQHFSAADIETIRAHKLDFILKFAFGILRGDVLTAAEYGVWSFHHGDEEKYRGGPPAFWEIYYRDPVTAALLQRLTERLDGGVVLKKCFVPTHGLSHRKNLQRIQDSSAHMVRWVSLDILNGRAEYLSAPPSKTRASIYRAPNDFQVLRFWTQLARNWLRYKIDNQRVDQWNVGLVKAPQSAFLDPAFRPTIEWSGYREHIQFVADPFLLPSPDNLVDGAARIMVEELNWSTERGRICELRIDGDGHTSITPLIDDGLHLSYPFAFVHNGVTYAMPECSESRAIRLYRLNPATGAWSPDHVLIENIDAVDATVFEYQDRWWLLHSGTKGCAPWSLYVWHAPDLLGPWQPHTANPVKTDARGSRPGGNVFWHEGQLYRPAQDGRYHYGYGLAIQRIDELTRETYRETTVREMAPDPRGEYRDGFHTLSGFGDYSVVDGKKHTWPVWFLMSRFLAKRLRMRRKEFRYKNVAVESSLPVKQSGS